MSVYKILELKKLWLKLQAADGKKTPGIRKSSEQTALPPVKGQPCDSVTAEQCYSQMNSQEKPGIQICEWNLAILER